MENKYLVDSDDEFSIEQLNFHTSEATFTIYDDKLISEQKNCSTYTIITIKKQLQTSLHEDIIFTIGNVVAATTNSLRIIQYNQSSEDFNKIYNNKTKQTTQAKAMRLKKDDFVLESQVLYLGKQNDLKEFVQNKITEFRSLYQNIITDLLILDEKINTPSQKQKNNFIIEDFIVEMSEKLQCE